MIDERKQMIAQVVAGLCANPSTMKVCPRTGIGEFSLPPHWLVDMAAELVDIIERRVI